MAQHECKAVTIFLSFLLFGQIALSSQKKNPEAVSVTHSMGSKKRSRVVHTPAEPIKNKVDWEEQAATKRVKKNVEETEESEKTLLPVEALTEQITNEDFRIVAGSYERILYGVNAFWESKEEKEVGYLEANLVCDFNCLTYTMMKHKAFFAFGACLHLSSTYWLH